MGAVAIQRTDPIIMITLTVSRLIKLNRKSKAGTIVSPSANLDRIFGKVLMFKTLGLSN